MAQRTQQLIDVHSSLDEFYDYVEREHWGDGFPVIPPTPERVQSMIAPSGRDPEEVLFVLEPRLGVVTIEAIAANAVMAGCRPSFFPIVVAALDAAVRGNSVHQHTTSSASPLLVVNGPGRDAVGINYQEACFGPAGRANATIGRALRLCLINIGGALPGIVSKSVFGQPGRYSLCIGEQEELSPWDPLHVRRGFNREQNCVSAIGVVGTLHISDVWSRSAESYLLSIAHSMNTSAGSWMILPSPEMVIALTPAWAEIMSSAGFSISDVATHLWEQSQLPLSQFPSDHWDMLRSNGRVLQGDVVTQTTAPEKIHIVVAGGIGGLHCVIMHTAGTEWLETTPFELT